MGFVEDHDARHVVNAKWREAEAEAVEARITAIDDWLDHTEDLIQMFENDTTVTSGLRGVAGTLRSRRNDFDTTMGKLRADMNGQKE